MIPIADFTPIGGIGFFPFILAVDAKIPVKTPQEFVSWARANKGSVFYAYGTPTVQIPAEAINKLEKLEATGVPYKSSPDAMTDVIGGRAQFMVVDLASSQPQVKAGRLRALAVTSSKRTSLAPDLPTVEETLGIKDFDLAAWTGLFGPANLPKDIVDKLNAAMQKILNRPDVRERMLANYNRAHALRPGGIPGDGEETARRVGREGQGCRYSAGMSAAGETAVEPRLEMARRRAIDATPTLESNVRRERSKEAEE